jgi:hypothetical protein
VSWISSRITHSRNSELSASQICVGTVEDADVIDGMDMRSPLRYQLKKEAAAYTTIEISRRQVRSEDQTAALGNDLALGVDQRVWRFDTARPDQAAEASNFQAELGSQFLPRSLLSRLRLRSESHLEGG